MAASGYTPISLYYSTTASAAPTSGNLVAGELALNTLDEKLYFKNSAGAVKLLASNSSSTGTVSSVGLSLPSIMAVTNSPVTTSGTLTGTLTTQAVNAIFAGPSSGAAAAPTFRALTTADIPALPYGTGSVTSVALSLPSIISVSGSPVTTSGTLTGALTTQAINAIFAGPSSGAAAAPTFRALTTADIPALSYVTSVALALPSIMSVSGSPVTGSGTLTGALTTQSANAIFAGPSSGAAATPTFRALTTADIPALAYGTGTVTSVGWTGGIVSIATATTTPAFTIAGTSGGIPYFSSGTTWATSAALAASAIVLGGGAGAAPATTTTGTGVVTAIGNAVNTTNGLVTQTATLTASALLLGGGASTGIASTTTGTGVVTALGINVGSAGAFTTNNAANSYTATQTFYQGNYTNNPVTVAANAGTVPITYRLNTFTNSSAATMTITLTTTSAVDGQMSIVRVYDFSAVAQTITWVNTENSSVSVPTTSNGSTTLPKTVGFMYNAATSKWRCIASA